MNVNVNGKIPHKKVPIILAKHNVLVFPSRIEEAFGRVLVEAMASGCIPISSFIGGTKDIIEEGKNGYFFEPGNSKSLNKLLKTLNLGKINKNNLKNSVKRYSGNNISSNLINIYKSIIHKANKTDKFINIKWKKF